MSRTFTLAFITLILSGACMSVPQEARATHAAGGELVYEWLRDSTYRVFFRFFSDCEGNYPALDEFDLCYYNPCNGASYRTKIKKMSLIPGNLPNGTPLGTGCPGVLSKCESRQSVVPGFEEWWYMVDIGLPSRCDNWILSISLNARNAASNLVNADRYNLYMEATLNNQDTIGFAGRNHATFSSPYFSVKPIPYVCLNTPVSFSGGPVDPNGDVLVYEFITPRHIGANPNGGPALPGANCQPAFRPAEHMYQQPFGLGDPFATNGTFVFNTRTSAMTFTPSALSKNTVTVRVNKFRGGIKLGSVMRDVQFQVINCITSPIEPSVIPTTVTGARLSEGGIDACAGVPFRFCYKIVAGLANSVLVVSDNHGTELPGSTVTYSNLYTDSILGCISWTTSDTGQYLLTIITKDSTCRAPGVIIPYTYVIPVRVRAAYKSTRHADICRGDSVMLTSEGTVQVRWSVLPGGSDAGSLSCTSCLSPVARPRSTTTYVASYPYLNTCGTGDTILVRVTENEVVLTPPSPIVLCKPDSVHLSAAASGPKPFAHYPCGLNSTPPVTPADTTSVSLFPGRIKPGSNPASTPFNGGHYTSRHQYLLRAADMISSGMNTGRLTSLSFHIAAAGSPAAFDHFSIRIGCTNAPLDVAGNFVPNTSQVYATASLATPVAAGWFDIPFDTYYDWDGKSDLVVDVCYANAGAVPPVYTSYYEAGYDATMYGYNFGGNICAGGSFITPAALLVKELPQMRFGWHSAPERDFTYQWSGADLIPSGDGRRASAWIAASSRIVVASEGRNGCVPADTIDIYIPGYTYAVRPDTTICAGASVSLYVRDTANPSSGFTSRWFESQFRHPVTLTCDRCPDPVAIPDSATLYPVVVTDTVGCPDTLYTRIKVDPFRQVVIHNRDTLVGFRERVQLVASGADRYQWTPDLWMEGSSAARPVVRPESSITYLVTGYSGACVSYDSVHITVDRRGLVFIPSAFSPNGDGINDEFRIGNFTFQKLDEFRVFNRWGQEVFSTLDGKKGWDGRWKDVPQNIGTYFYLVRISYPDGTEKQYKGDVTLIR